jgi:hypothetical protein
MSAFVVLFVLFFGTIDDPDLMFDNPVYQLLLYVHSRTDFSRCRGIPGRLDCEGKPVSTSMSDRTEGTSASLPCSF